MRALAPIFIFAPAARCGITLLQRLLNSTGRILIYGENSILINSLPQQAISLPATADQHAAARQRVIDGQYDFWSSAVWPDIQGYCRSVLAAIEVLLKNYQYDAAKDGFERWGIKNPLNDGRNCAFFYQALPEARFIFIYRHIVDVLRSHKARKWLRGERDCIDVVSQWCRCLSYMWGSEGEDRLMIIRYEDMTASPGAYADRLEQFVAVGGIDRRIFPRKLNTFVGSTDGGYSPTQYIEPEELSAGEVAVVRKLASDLLKRCHYPSVDEVIESRGLHELHKAGPARTIPPMRRSPIHPCRDQREHRPVVS